MKKILIFLLPVLVINSTSLLDSFKLNKINKEKEELTEREVQEMEKNSFTIKTLERKFNNLQYLETIRLINSKLNLFNGKEREQLLVLKLKSLYKLKEYHFVVQLAEKLDTSNKLTGINVAEMHIILAKSYLQMKKYTRFKTEISILNKNFSKNTDIGHKIELLNAWYNLEIKNYSQTIRLCETVLVETKNLDIASEAGFILAIVKQKTNDKSTSAFISDIVKHNPNFFLSHNDLVTENIEMFTHEENTDDNIFILEKTYNFLRPKEDFNTFKKFSLALIEEYRRKEDYPKVLSYSKKLRNYIGDLTLLEDLVDKEIYKMQILTGEKTLDSILEKTKKDKQKYEYFLVFKFKKEVKEKDYPSIIEWFDRYKEISSKVYKKHDILNKHEYINNVARELLRDYLLRRTKKENTDLYPENLLKALIPKAIGTPQEFLDDKELEHSFIETIRDFKEYQLNRKLFERYKDSSDINILKNISEMCFRNNDVNELVELSRRALVVTEKEDIDKHFDFYEYLVHGYTFSNKKLDLKNIIDFIVEKSPAIKDDRILGVMDTYYTFLNSNSPFGEYTQNEIEHTIYNYLSIASKHTDSSANNSNVYYFILTNNLFKKEAYNDMKLMLDKIETKDDTEKSKKNYFLLEYHKKTGKDKELMSKYIEECKSLQENDWKQRCINFK